MRKWSLILALAMVIAIPAISMAAVGNTQHDIDNYTGAGGYSGSPPVTTGGTCAYCHIPHKALGARLWPSAPVVGTGPWLDASAANKTTPRLCNSCHNSTSTYTLAQTVRPFEATSHAATAANMTGWGDSAIPAATRLDNNSNLECASCHDVHNNTYRPFLAHTASVDLYENCAYCHNNRPNNTPVRGAANNINSLGSQHPTNSPATTAGRLAFLATIDNAFRVAVAASPGVANSGAWGLGGHYRGGTNISCQTCHAVHGTEAAAASNNLTAIENGENLLPTSALCQGCHAANPGAAGTSTHPVNTLQTSWDTTVNKPAQWPWGLSGGVNTIVCSSCHDMHFASPLTALYRRNGATTNQNATALSTYGTFCAACHTAGSGTNWPVAEGAHHPVAAVTSGTNIVTIPVAVSTAVNWTARSKTDGAATYALDNNSMTCASCHSGGNAGAHNNTGTFPGVTGLITESQMCVDCHSFNPSTYLVTKRGTAATQTMTHFVGNIATLGYKRTTAFGNSGIIPKYAAAGANGSIICESCHVLAKNSTLVARGMTGAVKQLAGNDNTVPAKVSNVASTVTLLVETSGNNNQTATAANYLCTGCHGASPGGGSTHPTLPTMAVAASAALIADIQTGINVGVVQGQTTLTSNNRVNCESCHRPHNAAVGTGAVILESQVTTPASAKPAFQLASDNTNYMNQEGMCVRCHTR